MSQLQEKFRHIIIPSLFVVVGFIGLYTFLHWLVFIRLELIPLDEDLLLFWLPFLLSWVPVLIWFRDKIKMVAATGTRELVLQLFLALSMAIPTIVVQHYLVSATGKLTPLQTISDIGSTPKTKYYSLKNCYLDKEHIGVQHAVDVSGRSDEHFNMHLYLALPILDKAADTASHVCAAWYAIHYSETLDNDLSGEEKEAAYKKFINETADKYEKDSLTGFSYLERVPVSEAGKAFQKAIASDKTFTSSDNIILRPRFGTFEDRNSSPVWMPLSFLLFFGVWACIVVYSPLRKVPINELDTEMHTMKEHQQYSQEHQHQPQQRTGGPRKPNYDVLKIRKGYVVTPLLIYINVGVFLAMAVSGLGVLSFSAEDLLRWGADFRPYTVNGQWWRLVTSMFLHGGLLHVAMNMYGLLFAAGLLERLLGSKKLLIVYMVTGIVASLASIAWHPATVSVGASGAIFGLFGVLLALLILDRKNDLSKGLLMNMLFWTGINLTLGFSAGIDNAAHIGGLVSGLIIGSFLAPGMKRKLEELRRGGPASPSNQD
ncbi:rhomboid family intramembrane serine protease [Chitinophaga sp. Cy-1792]|uniref:rhomboid family intramembrane serine protease n=1 Tax=Chitinophaga sp. Cy-1792 TaxID=2608339 RepID=UPI001423BA16|nr:rhomboid family intramembrane serine protease [Chitinophaga sp. Cy-1792]NIG53374.1 rhomboid family intramembrane serine protease [Chitinophaga sp. Cy-1792]